MDDSRKHLFSLVDCNNFYASCERVFNPGLEKKPVVVLSNNDGCAVAMSNEAKGLGIRIGTPVFQVKDLIEKHNMQVFSSNYTLYGDMSRRVMSVLSEYSPDIEIYSIDECFLGLDGLKENLTDFGLRIKKHVWQWTGIPVSVGIARTKTLAKIANRIAKKNKDFRGVCDLSDHPDIDSLLKKISVGDVWGIGHQSLPKLESKNIQTALDLKNAPDIWVRKNLGGIVGLRTVWELRGISCIPLETEIKAKKQIICSRSFGIPVDNIRGLIQAVSIYTATAAMKLRQQNSTVKSISVFINTNRFKDYEPQYNNSANYKFEYPTNITGSLIDKAIDLLQSIYKEGYRYKKAGVVLSDIVPESELEEYLFIDKEEIQKKQRLMKTVDGLNAKYGGGTVKHASFGEYQSWIMKREHLSPRYTTCWNDILKVFI